MTIEQYLQGRVDFNLNDTTIPAILYDRGITEGTDVRNVTQKQKDLALADLYMFLATSSTSSSGDYESDGGWQRQRSSKNVYDRKGLISLAKSLYDKWGEETSATTIGKVVMRDLYGKS